MKKLIYVCLLTMTGIFTSITANSEVVIIVHSSNMSEIDQQVIRRIFLGKMNSFRGGRSAEPVALMEGSDTTEEFNEIVLRKNAKQLKSYWSQRIFTGKGTPPKQFATDAEVIDLVANTPGAIGYISSSDGADSVRIVGKFER